MSKLKQLESRGEHVLPALGDNADEILRGYVKKHLSIVDQITNLNGELKDNLNEAKNAGFLKGGIRKGAQLLRMTEEQRQSKNEVDLVRDHVFEICKEQMNLPLGE